MQKNVFRLGSVCSKIGSGATPTGGKETYQGGGYKLIRSQNVVDLRFAYEGLAEINEKQAAKLNNVQVEEKDVLLNITGDSVARCCLAPIDILPARVNQHVAIIRPKAEILNPYYLLFWLIVNKQYLLALAAAGATRNGLTKAMISGLVLECPSLEKQNRIASILSTYDTLIENNTKRIRLLEKMAENLYKEWFVRFRFPGHEKVEMENGLPKGWKRGTLSDVVEFQNGFAFKSDTFCNGGMYSIVTIKNVQAEGFDGSNTDKIAEIPQRMPGYCKLRQGDILISLTGNIGRVCRVQGYGYLLNQRVAKLKSSFPFYTYCLFKSDYIFQSLNVISYGTAQLNLSPIKASKIRVAIPSQKNIEYFEHKVSSMFNELDNLQHQNTLLARQRDLLLPRLMSGKLEVTP